MRVRNSRPVSNRSRRVRANATAKSESKPKVKAKSRTGRAAQALSGVVGLEAC